MAAVRRPAPPRRKLVTVGDGACGVSLVVPCRFVNYTSTLVSTFPGKTSLLCVFAHGEFPTMFASTILENYVVDVRLTGGEVELALWDTAGQEEYERLRPLTYHGSDVILMCYSIDYPDSLENVPIKVSIAHKKRHL